MAHGRGTWTAMAWIGAGALALGACGGAASASTDPAVEAPSDEEVALGLSLALTEDGAPFEAG